MKTAEGRIGRVFVIRLEEGDELPGCIESFAAEKGVKVGYAMMVGGISQGEIVVGPRETKALPPDPMKKAVTEAHEASAVGIIAPGEDGTPILHMHGSLGRDCKTMSGCFRPGVKTWLTGEVMLYEVIGTGATRVIDEASGFPLLQPGVTAKPSRVRPPQPEVVAPATESGSVVLYLLNAEVN